MITDRDNFHENHKDDQGDGEDAVEHHVSFVMFANNALALHVLSPPDPLLVQGRPHLHLLGKLKKVNALLDKLRSVTQDYLRPCGHRLVVLHKLRHCRSHMVDIAEPT